MTQPTQQPVVPSVVIPTPASAQQVALAALRERLNAEQQAVASWRPTQGNLRVVAAAGSGKTTTSVALIGNLLASGVNPYTLVATTFTARAGRELRERLTRVVAPAAMEALRVGTFHALAVRALRGDRRFKDGRNVDLTSRAEGVYAGRTLWSRACSGNLIPGLNETGTGVGEEAERVYPLAIEAGCRARGIAVGTDEAREACAATGLPQLHEVWRLYEEQKKAMDAYDFHDLLVAYYEVVRQQPGGCVVLVDEAQDNNLVQLGIALALAGETGRVVLVGDVRQSIYGWRGAAPDLFLTADKAIGAQTLFLSTNYRSGRSIVKVGNAVAAGKRWSLGPPAGAGRDFEGEVTVSSHDSDLSEATDTSHEIARRLAEGVKPDEIAILCRTRAQQGGYEAALLARRIPVVVIGGSSYFASADWKDFGATLACINGDAEEEDVKRFVERQPGCGFFAARAASAAFARSGDVAAALDAAVADARQRRTREALLTAQRRLVESRDLPFTEQATRASQWLVAEAPEGTGDDDRRGALVMAAAIAARFDSMDTLRAFARRCAGSVTSLNDRDAAPTEAQGRVTISTIHKAKGLEWPVVYVSATSGSFPHARSMAVPERLEEEERLFYVAVTRARDVLRLTFSTLTLGRVTGPSPFLAYAPQPPAPTEPPPSPVTGSVIHMTETMRHAALLAVAVKHHGTEAVAQAVAAGEIAGYQPRLLAGCVDCGHRCPTGSTCERCGGDTMTPSDTRCVACDVRSMAAEAEAREIPEAAPGAWLVADLRAALRAAEPLAVRLTEASPRPAPGQRFVPVALADFEALLGGLRFVEASDLAARAGQRVLAAPLADGGRVVVYSTVPRAGEQARGRGEDSIRVTLLDAQGKPRSRRLPYAARTRGWRVTLLDRLVTVLAAHPSA